MLSLSSSSRPHVRLEIPFLMRIMYLTVWNTRLLLNIAAREDPVADGVMYMREISAFRGTSHPERQSESPARYVCGAVVSQAMPQRFLCLVRTTGVKQLADGWCTATGLVACILDTGQGARGELGRPTRG